MIGLLIELSGLLTVVKTNEQLSVVALNVDAEPKPPRPHPWHQPTLTLDRLHVVPGSARPNAVFPPRRSAYDLADTFVSIRPRDHIKMQAPQILLTQLMKEEPDKVDEWFNMWWSLDIRDEFPQAALRQDWPTCPAVASRLDVSGGFLFAFRPKNIRQEKALWSFNANAKRRVLTDRLFYLGVAEQEFEIEIRSRAGAIRQIGVRVDKDPDKPLLSFAQLNCFPMSEVEGEFEINSDTGEFSHVHFSVIYDLLRNPPHQRTVPKTSKEFRQATDACLTARIVEGNTGILTSIETILHGDIGAAVHKKLKELRR